jgi:hypothetical protein
MVKLSIVLIVSVAGLSVSRLLSQAALHVLSRDSYLRVLAE